MVSKFSSTTPVQHSDGTISAIVRDIRPLPPSGLLLQLWLPIAYDAGAGFGRYFLARCCDDTQDARRIDWSIYGRRALFCAGTPVATPAQMGSTWELLIPADDDPGHRWLAQRSPKSSLNLMGPFGQPFELASHTRALVVLTDAERLPLTLPVVSTMLDRAGRVTLLLLGNIEAATSLLSLIPIAVEVRSISGEDWLTQLAEPIRWADQLCAALPNTLYSGLAHHIRSMRFQLDNAFAYVLVSSDLFCGMGACLSCVVAKHDGSYTRACIHGPVFPLAAIAD
jgi:dihydroorotate dehydrogenase electron transfer subunit